ncbi:hypothetical protein Zmor_005342 [Zophobas morio]|uniref:Uncharacterized protein n=1 Tax=Zophobas morio TaxID=2755281 RepID=A0AA38IPU1_9CUCU|nr:hypothetical protein Zmor_005342 [Zophobas morio]
MCAGLRVAFLRNCGKYKCGNAHHIDIHKLCGLAQLGKIATVLLVKSSNKVAATEVKISPDMSTAVTNGHQASSEDFAKHVFGGKLTGFDKS